MFAHPSFYVLIVICVLIFGCGCLCVLQTLRVTTVGIEIMESKTRDLRWCLDFRDMDSPAIIVLSDAYGKKGEEGGGFVICPMYGRKCKAFMATSGVSNTAIISKLVQLIN
jgi:DnaJ family protein C protein 13